MQALVIYDNAGNIWNVTYGDSAKPETLGSAHLEIPDGSQITGMDLSNPDAPRPVFESIPASDYTNLRNQIKEIETALLSHNDIAIENDIDTDYRLSVMELDLI